jgi:uroporphyrinogen-III synthase
LRVAITRPRERAEETERIVRKRGWEALIIPSVEIVPLPIDPTIKLKDFDWLIVTSASGVDVLWECFNVELNKIDIAVVGPKTKEAFERRGILPKVVAKEHVGEGLAKDLIDLVKGKRVLVARATKAREGLVEWLEKVSKVTEVGIYDTHPTKDKSEMKKFKSMLEKQAVDAVVLTSSLSTKNLIEYLGEDGLKLLNKIVVCAIGPITAESAREMGVAVTCVPQRYTVDAALEEISKHIFTSRWI